VTRPTSTFLGSSARNDLAASCAAAIRVGLMSPTRMLSETSIASMIEVLAQGSGTRATGRAAASSRPAQASGIVSGQRAVGLEQALHADAQVGGSLDFGLLQGRHDRLLDLVALVPIH
jgi:hypothetical protein